ncbi:glycoside hydrolase family 2 TIM barrel-domain containing protein [Candidatus Epulonipiscium viviparus]|uniref:glycoside hydrolase family 2 TIM barrel-domain containing protein n=1 Tax=Candidatus Epulonipiscium viviparus TaxID=420336 RepID=UPI0027380E34|nr:glycoside hydrolase family 2 TIM barrel-domain containing protein [Candidatus Epulopiscium viviparus]
MKHNWKFKKGEMNDAYRIDFDDSDFRIVSVPHDYAIEGPFSPDNDKQGEKVEADGIHDKITHVGRTGALPITDWAWYRKEFFVDKDAKNVFLEFDGIMCNSTIYVNETEVGGRIYGYSSFSVDITSACKFGENNLLAISVRPEGNASRWYPGAGVYRNVRLVQKGSEYFPYLPLFIRPAVKGDCAEVAFDINVATNEQEYMLDVAIYDQEGKLVASQKYTSTKAKFSGELELENYHLWEILNSYLYTFEAKLYIKGKEADIAITKFGIRTIDYGPDKGLYINNKYTKLNGVCMHHDLGALGAVVNISAINRQIEKLIDIGVNAIRFSHNPPSPEYLDACDRYGIVTIDEAFDEWKIQKVSNGYGKHFNQEGEKDIRTMVKRDRNHPSIIMWSIGNEILEQRLIYGWKYAKFLSDICHEEDPTRPTTAGFNNTEGAFTNGLAAEVDIVGANYKPHQYVRFHNTYPDAVLYGSETSSCLSSRGHYYLPKRYPSIAEPMEDLQMCSYDMEGPAWAYYPEREIYVQKKNDYLLGEFVWTGFDYLGEPTPYRLEWPSRSSYFGIYDLAGLKKDRAYSYMSAWTDKEFIHILPHWNWNEGDVVDIHCYTHAKEAELFVNGVSYGIKHKDENDELLSNRLIWKYIKFVPGEITVVAQDKTKMSATIKTAGEPAQIKITPERTEIKADGEDLIYFVLEILDKDGVLCPKANNRVDLTVDGGEYVAADAGDATSLRMFTEPYCEAFSGKLVAIAKSSAAGTLTLKATAPELGEATAKIQVK